MLALLLAAACGGERQAESGTAGAATDTARQPVQPDTASAAAPDTAASRSAAPASPATADTAKQATSTAQAEPKPAPKPKPKPTPKPEPAANPAPTAQDTEPGEAAQPGQPAPSQPPADTQPTQGAQQSTDAGGAAASQETAPLRDQYHQAPKDTVSQVVYDGWKQYNLNCARCHGEDVLGTTIAPHLIVSMKPNGPINTQESFVQVVCAGRPAKGMPSWCALGLEMDKINAIYSYVKGRSEGDIGPGRPAVKQEG